jgi:arylsulfatase A-like enzyme
MKRRLLVSTVLAVSLFLGLLATTIGEGRATSRSVARPSVVLVLMDDFSTELLATMPNAQRLVADGASYPRSYVVDSLCCPSRTSLMTGRYPHQTGVLLNTPNSTTHALGGYQAFEANGDERDTFNLRLQRAGYTTGFVGKFLNGYEVGGRGGRVVAPHRVAGWDDFQAVFGGGYRGWGFWKSSVEDGRFVLQHYAKPRRSAPARVKDRRYAQNVIGNAAVRFVREHRGDGEPYYLEVAPYAPHGSITPAWSGEPVFPPAFRDRPSRRHPGGNCGLVRCSQLSLHDLVGYGDPRTDNRPFALRRGGRTVVARAWNTARVRLTAAAALEEYRDRARMVQSIDRFLGRLRAAVGPDTYLILTSDNGFHLGQHRLNGGKGTAYDHDTNVPLVVVGPGVVPGPRPQLTSNVDIGPTIEELAGLSPSPERAGVSFAASLTSRSAPGRRFAFVEHTWGRTQPGEPDADRRVGSLLGQIPSYVAVRSRRGLLVRLDLDGGPGTSYGWELYAASDRGQLHNVFAAERARPWARQLRHRLLGFVDCAPDACRRLAA